MAHDVLATKVGSLRAQVMELAEAARQPVSMGAVYLSKAVQTDLVKPLTWVTGKLPQELSVFTDDLSR